MSDARRLHWNETHRAAGGMGAAEPSLAEAIALLKPGLALDIAAGTGRNSLAIGRAGFRVIAIDYSEAGLVLLSSQARREGLAIWPVAADLTEFPIPRNRFDLVVNVCFLERAIVPALRAALRPGGAILFDTFTVDQAAIGHPRNPDFLLGRYELRAMLEGLELVRYREGIVTDAKGVKSWRAMALAVRTA